MERRPLLMLMCFFSLFFSIAGAQENSSADTYISENIEWTQSWVVSTNDHDLPRVLVIGDSHVNMYYPELQKQLSGKVYTCKYTTSRSLGDPVLIRQFSWFLNTYQFDIIAFNNGLHGKAYSLDQYRSSIPEVYELLQKTNPEAKLIWINTTARRVRNHIGRLDMLNAQVVERNRVVSEFTSQKDIPVVDSYSLSYDHPEFYLPDGIHFNKEGIKEEALGVASEIVKVLKEKE